MTTKFQVPRIWEGRTVAVLASGASLTQELADSVRHLARVCARRAVRRAPDADMLIALDGPPFDTAFWEETRDFAGTRICGCEVDGLEAAYLPMAHERITLREGHQIEVRNNGLAAIRVAAMAGASKILLLGFDRPDEDGHHHYFYDHDGWFEHGWIGPEYPGMQQGLTALIAELRGKGIEIERVDSPVSALAPEESVPAPQGRRRRN